jgi:hypothetical protein
MERGESTAGKVGAIVTHGAPVDEAPWGGGAEISHTIIGCLNMDDGRAFIKLAEYQNGGGDVKPTNLYSENEHSGESPVLETILFSQGGDSCKIQGAWCHAQGLSMTGVSGNMVGKSVDTCCQPSLARHDSM